MFLYLTLIKYLCNIHSKIEQIMSKTKRYTAEELIKIIQAGRFNLREEK